MSQEDEYLTPLQIEFVLSAIKSFRWDKTFKNPGDDFIFESLRENIRESLSKQKVILPQRSVPLLYELMREKFFRSLTTPGINEGSRAASANSEPLTQATLKAAQRAGAKSEGNPILELLAMSPIRTAEYIYTIPKYDYRPPESYVTLPENEIANFLKSPPLSIDELIAIGFKSITAPLEPLIIRAENGAVCSVITIEPDDPFYQTCQTTMINIVTLSIAESLKIQKTPFGVLDMINKYLNTGLDGFKGIRQTDGSENEPACSCALKNITTDFFEIAIWSSNSTIAHTAAHSIVDVGVRAEGTGLSSFAIIHHQTIRAITYCEYVDNSQLGLLASVRQDETPARTWLVYLSNPSVNIPAKHVCLFLVKLGFRIAGVDRNAAGRCTYLRVREYVKDIGTNDLKKWLEDFTKDVIKNNNLRYNNTNQDVVTWEIQEHEMMPYIFYRVIKYRGYQKKNKAAKKPKRSSSKAEPEEDFTCGIIHKFFNDPSYDWAQSYSNVIVDMVNVTCTPVARQIMDREMTEATNAKVSQVAIDYVTLYACGMGPIPQQVSQSAINGGPLASMNENPSAVLTNAAYAAKTYGLSDQSEIVTGAMSRVNGASSVIVKDSDDIANSHFTNSFKQFGIGIDTTVHVETSVQGAEDDIPQF